MTGGDRARRVLAEDDDLASLLPQYAIGGQIGVGGFGTVLAATHRSLDRADAIKVLSPRWRDDEQRRERFVTEARLLARLDHPHIVRIHHFVQDGAICALVMERLTGGTLATRFAAGLTPEQSCAVVLGVLGALQAAHDRRVLHRDIKPVNILFAADGTPKVADFGIAKIITGDETLATPDGQTICGTPPYMSPEQVVGGSLRPATDVYAAGAVLYELLTGAPPHYADGEPDGLLLRRAYSEPRRPSQDVPSRVAAAIMEALARVPGRRHGSAEAFAVALAAAASAEYGPDWLDRCGVPVHLTPAVVRALTRPRPRIPAAAPGRRATVVPVAPVTPAIPSQDVGTGRHRAGTRPALGRDDSRGHGGTSGRGEPGGPGALERPGGPGGLGSPGSPGGLGGPGESALVPVRDMLPPPASPRSPAVAAAVLAFATLLLALLATGGLPAGRSFGAVLNPAAGSAAGTVRADLSEPVPVTGRGIARGTYRARLTVSSTGVRLGTATSEPVTTEPGRPWRATVLFDAGTRWVAGGALRGRVQLVPVGRQPTPPAARTVTVVPDQSPLLTVMGVGSLLLALFALAYLESILRALRQGEHTRAGPPAAGGIGVLLGVAVWLAAAVLLRREPRVAVALCCALLAAAAATAAAVAARRGGVARGLRD